jgi:UTP:GlnB (protein PII) uridylyltransferase
MALDGDQWRIDFAARDRVGLIAHETAVFNELGYDVRDALAVTWGDGSAVASFKVTSHDAPVAERLRELLQQRFDHREPIRALPTADLTFDDHASPWHTLCRVHCPDEAGVLRAITSVFAACGASVHAARITTDRAVVVDVFELTDRSGNKLAAATETLIARVLRTGTIPRRRRFWSRRRRDPASGSSENGSMARDLPTHSNGTETLDSSSEFVQRPLTRTTHSGN